MKAIVCLGKYAKNPYCFEKLGVFVYSMEELSYCLKENAFLLDTEIMEDGLLRFIDTECEVPQLARELYSLVHQKGSLSAFVTIILEYVGFYDKETISGVESTIKSGCGLTDYEKRKLRADHLAGKKKYTAALEAYDEILKEPQMEEKQGQYHTLLTRVLHNKGVVLSALFLYKEAAECFQRAYEISADKRMLKSYLAAKRMELGETEYIALIAQTPDSYEISLQIEEQMEQLEKNWLKTTTYAGLQNMKEWGTQGYTGKYYEECGRLLQEMKDEYRGSI